MTEHIAIIVKKLENLARMREYLRYSISQVTALLPIENWQALEPDQHETLAAFRVRFSEYQEHMGKTMKAIAVEEEKPTEPFTAVLNYMEKLSCIESVERWKDIRELRNAVNHEYEEDPNVLHEFFAQMIQAAPELLRWHEQLNRFCQTTYLQTPYFGRLDPLPHAPDPRPNRHHQKHPGSVRPQWRSDRIWIARQR